MEFAGGTTVVSTITRKMTDFWRIDLGFQEVREGGGGGVVSLLNC